jgi:hypothetical protein
MIAERWRIRQVRETRAGDNSACRDCEAIHSARGNGGVHLPREIPGQLLCHLRAAVPGAKFLGRVIEMTDNKPFVISTGYISLLLGLATVILHNVWIADWRVVITILGWSTLIKGILKIGFPELIHRQAQLFKSHQTIEAVIVLALGGFLLSMTFT